jgi:hypothetical protein
MVVPFDESAMTDARVNKTVNMTIATAAREQH